MTTQRRKLQFDHLEQAVDDAENLLQQGYDRAGNWDLGQCCHHLALWMEYPIDGFPRMPFPLSIVGWMLKHTIARRQLQKVLDSGGWPQGTPTDKRSVPRPGGNDTEAVEHLRQATTRLINHTGPFQPSPLFGDLDKETLLKLHRIHTAHHLSFLVPKGGVAE